MDMLVSICLGIGLAAACGFRVFVPLLAISASAIAGRVELAPGMEWIGTWPALLCFLTATSVEIAGYYVPWLDNMLDTLATPAAIVAGTVVTASMVQEMSPMLRWTLALIAGGGIAGLIQLATVALRGTSTATTLGLGNFVVATLELVLSVATTMLAFAMPVIAMLVIALFAGIALRIVTGRRRPKIHIKPAA